MIVYLGYWSEVSKAWGSEGALKPESMQLMFYNVNIKTSSPPQHS